MESCSSQKSVKQINLRFFKVSTLCLDRFAHSCHSLNQLYEIVTWNAFNMCYFIVLMSSLLFYNVENSKNKEKPLNE